MTEIQEFDAKNLSDLLKLIGLKSTDAINVKVKTEPYSEINFCFPNVERKVREENGEVVYGWRIWKHIFMIEAEFHSVWRSPEGELIDISPDGFHEIIFVLDERLSYLGKQIDNIRLNITQNRLVDDYIELFRARYRLLNSNGKEMQTGMIRLSTDESKIYQEIEHRITRLKAMIDNKLTPNSACFCGSNGKYKHCHGKDLKQSLSRLVPSTST